MERPDGIGCMVKLTFGSVGSMRRIVCLQRQCWETQVLEAPEVQIQLVEQYRQYAVLSVEALWLRCFELGGMNTQLQLDAFLHGITRPTPHEHNLMAVALNQYFMDFDPSQFAPYIEDGFVNNN